MKKYILFAGVNGAGKTTLYQSDEEYKNLPRINMDEIVREFGSWKNTKDVSRAGMIAVKKINEYFDRGQSFNQETTLCGKSIFRNIERAKLLGYEVILYYVGVAGIDTAKERVRLRVKNGGHGIPDEDIVRRYSESIANLESIIPICEQVKIYDNTDSFVKVASFINGKCVDRIEDIPLWCRQIII